MRRARHDDQDGPAQGHGKPIDPYVSDITLGSGTTNPMSLANAYATLAASGKYCEPYPITSITTSDKKSIKVPGPQCKQVIPADAADGATSLLKGTLEFGTAKGNLQGLSARPAAGRRARPRSTTRLVRRLHQEDG